MNLRKWLSLPVYRDKDKDSIARPLYAIQLALVVVFIIAILLTVLTGRYELALIIGCGGIPLFIEIWLVRHEYVKASGLILLFTLLTLAIYLMYIGDGLIDIAILLVPAVSIVGSMLFTKRTYILLNLLSLFSLTWIAYEQYMGRIAARGKESVELFGDWAIAMLILPITSLASYMLAKSVRANLRLARDNEANLRSANLDLEREIAERKQAEEKIHQRLNELATVNAVSQVAISQIELNKMIEVTGEKLRTIQNVDSLYIALYDPQSQRINFPYWRSHGEIVQAPPLTLGQGLTSWVIENRKPLIILQDYEQQGTELGVVHRNFTDLPDTHPKSWIGLPMQVGEQVIGVLSIQNFEKEFAFSENDIRLWETIAANVSIAIQNAQLYTAAQQELTQRKQLIAELEAKNAELERFTYTVSHDLKSPIITIGGFLGYIEKDALAGDTERLRNDIARIQNATVKMKTLLDELLELSRIGRMMNPPENVLFSDIVQQSLELVSGRLDARHVRVTFAENLPVVNCDHARLIEVMQNLIDNAAKFMGDQPEPHIEIGQHGEEDGKPIFYVRDNGIGISTEFHEKIFGLFNKLDPNMEGTGVGLALVRRIVEFHGGRIWVESGSGEGATFFFTLPKAETEPG